MEKYILSSKTLKELEEIVTELGEPKFRAKQLHSWIYTKFAADFDSMTDISKSFRENLKNNAVLTDIKIKQRQISADKTIKYLLEYSDGNVAECVLMRFDNRPNLTACVSSQIGCAVGCVFCATGKTGFVRNLTDREIVEQIMIMQRDTGQRISNVVFMGQGEPLLNLDNVLNAIDIIMYANHIFNPFSIDDGDILYTPIYNDTLFTKSEEPVLPDESTLSSKNKNTLTYAEKVALLAKQGKGWK